jgi:hypothetical protein
VDPKTTPSVAAPFASFEGTQIVVDLRPRMRPTTWIGKLTETISAPDVQSEEARSKVGTAWALSSENGIAPVWPPVGLASRPDRAEDGHRRAAGQLREPCEVVGG